jgi:hypothetical protein
MDRLSSIHTLTNCSYKEIVSSERVPLELLKELL